MKKIDPEVLEKMAKQKNIDKGKIEKIADSYKGKSQNELIEELVKIGKTLEGKEEVVSKIKTFLDEDQRKKLDNIMNKISQAEVQDKVESKKSKNNNTKGNAKKQPLSKSSSKESSTSKNNSKSSTEDVSNNKKMKKVVKKVKKINHNN